MVDNSICNVFSNIYDHLCVENSPSIPSFLVTKIFTLDMVSKTKLLLFLLPFHSCAPCILISYCCLCQCQAVCYYYMPVPTKYHRNISFQKKCASICVVKNARNVLPVIQFVWQPFSIEFQGFVKRKIKYIHKNLRYYETIVQIHFMIAKK